MYRYAYLHGFASSSGSKKGVWLAEALAADGVVLERPDLNRPSFGELSHRAMIAAVEEMDRASGPGDRWRLVGSSLGGWLAARFAELHPGRVDRLVLLCPGFGLAERWPHLVGEASWARWRRQGALPLPDAHGRMVPVHWGFIEEARRQPAVPAVPCPTVIVHGRRDPTVPIEGSRAYAAAHPERVRLVEVDDDHALMGSLDTILGEVRRHFGIDGRSGGSC
ncbi:MAG: YqiA/YcfP family alpha/beta fold hydrolase [Myxococcota bacterium]